LNTCRSSYRKLKISMYHEIVQFDGRIFFQGCKLCSSLCLLSSRYPVFHYLKRRSLMFDFFFKKAARSACSRQIVVARGQERYRSLCEATGLADNRTHSPARRCLAVQPYKAIHPSSASFGYGWCWFVLREKYC
jgi:hypothetical protein